MLQVKTQDYQGTINTNVGIFKMRYLPIAKVIALSLSLTSFTTMLFWSGVERQHSTERHRLASARNLSSRVGSRA